MFRKLMRGSFQVHSFNIPDVLRVVWLKASNFIFSSRPLQILMGKNSVARLIRDLKLPKCLKSLKYEDII